MCKRSGTETEFLDVIGTKKLVCNVNIAFGNIKSENSQDYAQKPQRNCTSMNSVQINCISYDVISCM